MSDIVNNSEEAVNSINVNPANPPVAEADENNVPQGAGANVQHEDALNTLDNIPVNNNVTVQTVPLQLPVVNPEDSVSQVKSNTSSVSSRMKNIQREIELNYQLVALRETNALEAQKQEILRRQKEIQLRAELQAAKDVNQAYENLRESESEVTFNKRSFKPRHVSKPIPVQTPTTEIHSKENQRDQSLPTQEIKSFDGTEILNYQIFIKSFENVVERNTSDPSRRLEFILQYTSGEAHELIRYCTLIDPADRAYEEARKLLKRDYGDPILNAARVMDKAEKWTPIKNGDKEGLRKFAIFLINCSNSKPEGEYTTMDNYEFLIKLCSKLPVGLQQQWIREVGKIRDQEFNRPPTLKDFENFVVTISRNENDPRISGLGYQRHQQSQSQQNQQNTNNQSFKGKKRILTTKTKENLAENAPCLYCGPNTNHSLHVCRKFSSLTSDQKSDSIRKKGLCYGCLNPGHLKANCTNYGWSKCDRKHPTILHDPSKDVCDNQTKTVSGCALTVNTNRTDIVCDPLMSVALVRVRSKLSGQTVTTYAFIDQGSSSGFVTYELKNRLGIRCKSVSVAVKTLNLENIMKTECTLDSIEISDIDGESYFELPPAYLQDKMPVSTSDAPTQTDLNAYEHLKNIKIPNVKDIDIPRVSLMIGINVPAVTTPIQVATGKIGEPYGIKSPIGWLFYGFQGKLNQVNRINFCHIDQNLDSQVKYFFNLEFNERLSDTKTCLSKEDKEFIRILDQSVELKQGHYEMKLPFRDSNTVVPNNKLQAEIYMQRLKKRLQANEPLLEQYNNFMQNLVEKNYCELVPQEEIDRKDGRVWFIPHHPVVNPKKPNKVRVVFNCPVMYRDTSLNNLLLQGPDLTNSLLGILLRWRLEPIAVMADIEQMFYQVRVNRTDVDMLRFLWWPEGQLNNPLQEYRMLVHLFGAVSSPSCSNYALRKVAVDFKDEFNKDILECVEMDFYVDDFLKSMSNLDESAYVVNQLCDLLSKGGFNLTKFLSNSKELLKTIPENRREEDVKNLDFDKDRLLVKRALGVEWSVEQDLIQFNVNTKELSDKATKRNILSVMSSIYDPFGISSPFVLKAKIVLQELCREKVAWDEPISPAYREDWENWMNDLENLKSVKLRRCLKPDDFGLVVNTQLHHFADASQIGYGSVTYVRQENEDGEVNTSFLIARSRVAPIKPMTIPKLELSAATTVVRINNMLERELSIPVNEVFYWTDSQTVIKYIRNETTRHQIFVANRLAVIRDGSEAEQWRYIPSSLNPADHSSRGLSVKELICENWLKSPEFLNQPKTEWPENLPWNTTEEKPELVNMVNTQNDQIETVSRIFNHYSSWLKLKRAVAWWIRLKGILQFKARSGEIPDHLQKRQLDISEISNSETEILKCVQAETFSSEIKALNSNKTVKGSNIVSLDPILSENLLKVGGRLRNAVIPQNAKHQIILPNNHHVTILIVRDAHSKTCHQGKNHTLSEIRQNFWIIKGGSLVKTLVKNCIICRKYQSKRGEQKMSDLPNFRVKPDEPAFSSVGMDYFGPFQVKCGRSLKKRYGIVFTCMASRAIHLEVGDSLDTSSCISAIRRFIARRGPMKDLFSDNGTNLVGSNTELKNSIKELDLDELNNFGIKVGFRWHFNPPAASHHGGAWERQIRTVRKVLQSILTEQFLKTSQTDEQLRTFLCETESIVNSRPLVKVSDDINDLNVITPNSLLLLKPTTVFPCGIFNEQDQYSRRRWRQMQYLSDLFWKRWIREYLPELQKRQKWIKPCRNFREGDIALIVDETLPRGSWLLGRVTETFQDKLGNVRSVKIKTKSTVLTRPITKLCLLLEQESGENL